MPHPYACILDDQEDQTCMGENHLGRRFTSLCSSDTVVPIHCASVVHAQTHCPQLCTRPCSPLNMAHTEDPALFCLCMPADTYGMSKYIAFAHTHTTSPKWGCPGCPRYLWHLDTDPRLDDAALRFTCNLTPHRKPCTDCKCDNTDYFPL